MTSHASGSPARWLRALGGLFLSCTMLFAVDASAALSESGGSGVLEVQAAESHRPGRLKLGLFANYERLALGDTARTQLNGLRGGANVVLGFPGGFEASGSLPLYGYYTTSRIGGSPFDNTVRLRFGDVASRLRWTGPFVIPGMRWGLEGEVRFPTGDNKAETYPGRGAVRPYTWGERAETGRLLLTWDGLRAGSGSGLRLHANAAYTRQRDETRFLDPHGVLPLEIAASTRDDANDFLTFGGALEVELPRTTLFGEVVTNQFVNERGLMRGVENSIRVTPGIRFWLPGGASITGSYSFQQSKDDPATVFKPSRAFGGDEWRVALSLGTIYRGSAARAEDVARGEAIAQGPTYVDPAIVPEAAQAADTTGAARAKADKARVIIERSDVQEAPSSKRAAPSATTAAPPVTPAPARATGRLLDTDGDGIPDVDDQCPLLAEDWDGFQDMDGCPDLDNDQDGIPDVRDQCPNDPETYNGYYDFDGCPDEVAPKWIGPSSSDAPDANTAPGPWRPAPGTRARPPQAPAPVVTDTKTDTKATSNDALEAERRRNRELLDRLRDLERDIESQDKRMRDLSIRESRRGDAPAPTIVMPAPSSGGAADANRARFEQLSGQLRDMQSGLSGLQSQASQAQRDASQRELLDRLASMQASLDSLAHEQAMASAVVAPVVAPSDDATMLDDLLPVGRSVVLSAVRFGAGESSVDEAGRAALRTIGQALADAPGTLITVIAHTDNVGSARANDRLSRERARSVAAVLQNWGARPGQVTAVGRGESYPAASNATAAGRAANRRIEFVRNR